MHAPRRHSIPYLGSAILAVVTLAAGCSRARPGPAVEVALPGSIDALEPDVVALVDRHVALARAEPDNARAHGTLGLVYEANELWEPAAASFANAAALDPKAPLWDYHRSIALHEAGRIEEADRLLRESAAKLEGDPGVQHRLGSALLDAGEIEAASKAFARALAKAPDQPEILVGMAFVDLAKEDYAHARDLCLRALRRDSAYQQAHYALGLAFRGLGETQNASTAMIQGAAAKRRYLDDPLSAELRTYQVNTMSLVAEANRLLQAQHAEEALALWARIAARRPGDKAMLTNYGSVLLSAGRVDEAIEVLKRSLAVEETEAITHVNLAEAYVAKQDAAQALVHADRAVALAPGASRSHRARARVLALKQDPSEAYLELREAVRLDPKDGVAVGAIAEVCTILGRTDEALTWFRAALELDPTNLPARVNLARLTLRSGDAEGARIQLKELQRIAPDHPRVKALAAELGLPR